MKKETLEITGMSCGHCVRAVRQAIEGAGATALVVEVGKAEIEYPDVLRRDTIVSAIEEEGYQVVGG